MRMIPEGAPRTDKVSDWIPEAVPWTEPVKVSDWIPTEEWTERCVVFSDLGDWMTREDNQLNVQLIFFLGGFGVLYLCMMFCQICVFGVLVFCIITCLQYRLMNLLMWACIFVLWFHGWSFGGGRGFSLSWS